ncbi:hypothetical protein L8T26_05175 [Lactococcus petauri]|uniref:hypothetical protein n=1 Tax=Lactococcus petauri TaxID=1940789 RepID=UPI001EDEA15A|nr:hypothetical protein [Lactococcus petauri]MCG3096728.1 hypothetical protein [Lactococcus petauri]MDT2593702.1 hypothetical protein [Lactococcus petauri]
MSKPNGYLFRGAAFSSEESAFEILVKNREQELRFHETWEKEAKPYYFKDELSKLSIPKKIAKMLDVSFDFQPEYHEDVSWIVSNMDVLSDDFSYNEFYTWVDSGKDNYNIALTYLASKALGVELVEVEG